MSRRTLAAESKSPATLDTYLRTVRLFVQFLEACRGRVFESRRDLAILLLLIDTGMRRGEVASVQCHDLDLDSSLLRVMGKGGRARPGYATCIRTCCAIPLPTLGWWPGGRRRISCA